MEAFQAQQARGDAKPQNTKSSLCRHFALRRCNFPPGQCTFAHGTEELGQPRPLLPSTLSPSAEVFVPRYPVLNAGVLPASADATPQSPLPVPQFTPAMRSPGGGYFRERWPPWFSQFHATKFAELGVPESFVAANTESTELGITAAVNAADKTFAATKFDNTDFLGATTTLLAADKLDYTDG